MNAKKVVAFGEIMLRLSPPPYERIAFTRKFDACYAGGEANVAVSAANYGLRASFVSRIPSHEAGDAVLRVLREAGVDTEFVVRGGERLGIYFLEHGASVRASKVIYDRAHSAAAEASEEDFDFEKIFKGAHWFHVSGITPALSASCAKLTEKALKTARKKGLTTSFDLNYRKKLWTPEQAQKVCVPLMEYVDVCIGNEEDAEKVLGFKPKGTNVSDGTLNIESCRTACMELQQKFKFKIFAASLRESISASDNGWSAVLCDGKKIYQSKKYNLHIVDRIGSGDAFSGALIYSLISKKPLQNAVDFAAAASALKHTVSGDFNQVSLAEVEKLAGGDAGGRAER